MNRAQRRAAAKQHDKFIVHGPTTFLSDELKDLLKITHTHPDTGEVVPWNHPDFIYPDRPAGVE